MKNIFKDKELIELFEKQKVLAKELKDTSIEFGIKLSEYYDFPYNDTDDDVLIDSLDYGICEASFEYLVEVMNDFKNQV